MAEPLKLTVRPATPTEGTGAGGWDVVAQEPVGQLPGPGAAPTDPWQPVSQEPFVPGGGSFRAPEPEGPRPSPPISAGEPLGPPEPPQEMRGIWDRASTAAQDTYGQLPSSMDVLRRGGVPGQIVEQSMRVIPAVTSGLAGAAAGVAEHLGMGKAPADRLQRDLDILGNKVAPIAVPAVPGARALRSPKVAEWKVVKEEPAQPDVKVPTAEEYLKPIKLDLTHLSEYSDPATGERYITFAGKDEAGQQRARMDVMVTGDTVHLNDIRAFDQTGAELPPEAAKNVIGPKQMRGLLKQFREAFPEVKNILADRISGARTGGEYDVMKGKEISVALPDWQVASTVPAAPRSAGAAATPLPPAPATHGQQITPATTAEQAVLSRIGMEPKSPLYNKTDAYTDFVDNLHPFKKIMEGTAPVDTILNPYEQFRLTRGVGGKAEHMLHHGTFDFNTLQDVGPSFTDIVNPVMKEKESFKAYLLAKSAVERANQGIDTGVNYHAAKQVVKDGQMRFEQTRVRLKEYQDQLVQYLVDSGLVNKDMADTFRNANQDYIPWYRIQDEVGAGPAAGGGFRTRRPIYKMEGSERLTHDPLESIIRNTQMFITLAERNRANKTFVDWASGNAPGLVKRVQGAQPIEVKGSEVENFLSQLGIPPQLVGNLSNDSFNIFRNMQHKLASDEIAVWKDGKRQVYRTDPELAKIIQGMDEPTIRVWEKIMSFPAKMLRTGVVLSPEYMLRNFTRDQINASIQSPSGYRPVYDFMRGLGSLMANGPEYRAWLKSGGAQTAMISLDRDYRGADIWKYGNPERRTLMAQTKNVAMKPIEALRIVSESIDSATRVGEYMRATGGSTDVADMMRGGMASRQVTQDFQRHGAQTRAFNNITAFHNAQVQGQDRELSTLRNNPKRALPIIAAAITTPSVLLWAANHGDPRYEDAPWWEKDLFWFYLPADKMAEPIKIPKPFFFGMVFGSLPERMLSAYFDGKPDAYNKFLQSLSGTMAPNIIPTAVLPGLEQYMNRSIFLGRPLVPKSLTEGGGRQPSVNWTNPQTPEVANLAGGAISKIPGMPIDSGFASPIVINNYARQWGGTMGQYGMAAADKALELTGGVKKTPEPAATASSMPIIRAFVSRYPSANAQPISDFYENWDEMQRKKNDMRVLSKTSGDVKKDIMYEQDAVKRLGALDRGMNEVRKEIKAVTADPLMSPEQKRSKITQMYLELVHMAKEGNRVIREMGESGSVKPLETPSLQPGARHRTMGTWKALPPGKIIPEKPKYGGPL